MVDFWPFLFRLFRRGRLETYEMTQPWVIYTYAIPDWATRILGCTTVRCQCLICGEAAYPTLRVPRWGEIVDDGHHPERTRFLEEHRHPGVSGNPLSWEIPLRNPAALRPGDLEDIGGVIMHRARRQAEEGSDA